MIRGLKIFRIANIVEIVMMSVLFVLMLAVNGLSFKSTEDIIGVSIFTFMMAIVLWNCISNFMLIKSYKSGGEVLLPNAVKFWIIGLLFLITSLFLFLCIAASYPILEKATAGNPYEFFGMMLVVFWILFMAANGIYIFIKQIILFNAVKAAGYEENMKLLDEIGQPLE